MKKIHLLTLTLSLFALSAAPVMAQQYNSDPSAEQSAGSMAKDTASSGLKAACKADLDKYCKDVSPGEGRMGACLKAHDDKLSSECKQQWQASREKMKKEMKTACGSDLKKFCQDASSRSEIHSCLKTHASDLSSSCKNFQASMKQKLMDKASG